MDIVEQSAVLFARIYKDILNGIFNALKRFSFMNKSNNLLIFLEYCEYIELYKKVKQKYDECISFLTFRKITLNQEILI